MRAVMSRRPICALAVLLVALVACERASDEAEGGAGEGGDGVGGSAGKGGASGLGGADAGVGGGAAGRSGQGGAASGRGGAATSGGAGAGRAGRSSAGATAGAGESGGAAGGGGRAGSATLGGSSGRGGEVASGGSSALAGEGGEPNEPTSSCANPLDTVEVSRLVASEAFEPYVVTGDSANQIRQSIDQNRGMAYDAFTDWYVSWQFGDCAGNGLVVTVDVTYNFPEWEPSASASSELVASWESYIDALFCHEYGHAKHGLDCANDVFTALAAIDAGGCAEQQAEAEAAFSSILGECNQLDIQYDADTNHGATMGAVFPP